MELTAKELFELVGPVMDVIGFPEGLSYDSVPGWWRAPIHPSLGLGLDAPTTATVASALCRVAIEDWIPSTGFGFVLIVPPCHHNEKWTVAIMEADSIIKRKLLRCGPTLLHALVAAALAVRGEK